MRDDEVPPHPIEETTASFQPRAGESRRIGPYRILAELGGGGMGLVYLAEQTEPVRRRVALKIIKQGMDSRQVIARFEAERQALALMDHPAIARIYDAGTTPDGRPYFAMEHVGGIPITDHCDRERLTNPTRLELFLQVCEGVQHAHQKAVIHRDLKPSNVLVIVLDGRPMVKIIDFGIAKALGQRLTDRTLHTELGVMIGTPEYMSPEQAEMSGQDVDTRTDVYSLGVMLYELVVGVLPFESKILRQAGFDEIRRMIREDDPPRPSARLFTLGDRSTDLARRRQTEPPSLRRELVGDLDWITMKAIEKDRSRRYGSPSELAEDIRRLLRHEPVLAHAPSTRYRAGKFVRRHRAGVVASLAILLALVAATAVSTWQYLVARSARIEADARATAASLAAAVSDLERNDRESLRSRLETTPERLRGWEWRYLWNESDRRTGVPLTLPVRENGYRLRLSPDGTLVAARSAAPGLGPLQVFDTRTGRVVRELKTWDCIAFRMVFSRDNAFLAFASKALDDVQIYDLRTGKGLIEGSAKDQSLEHSTLGSDYENFLDFGPDGTLAAVTEKGTHRILLLRVDGMRRITALPAHRARPDPGGGLQSGRAMAGRVLARRRTRACLRRRDGEDGPGDVRPASRGGPLRPGGISPRDRRPPDPSRSTTPGDG